MPVQALWKAKVSTLGCLGSEPRRLRGKAYFDGQLGKKQRWDSQRQSDAPKPSSGMDAPGSVQRHRAHWCSRDTRS